MLAARRGDVAEARRVLERLGEEKKAWRLEAELRAAEGDLQGLADTAGRCAPPTYAGLLLQGLGRFEESRALLERAVGDDGCEPRNGIQRGLAHGTLALLAHERGDGIVAAEHLEAFRYQWPRPGLEVPLVQALVRTFGDDVVAEGALGDWLDLRPVPLRLEVGVEAVAVGVGPLRARLETLLDHPSVVLLPPGSAGETLLQVALVEAPDGTGTLRVSGGAAGSGEPSPRVVLPLSTPEDLDTVLEATVGAALAEVLP